MFVSCYDYGYGYICPYEYAIAYQQGHADRRPTPSTLPSPTIHNCMVLNAICEFSAVNMNFKRTR